MLLSFVVGEIREIAEDRNWGGDLTMSVLYSNNRKTIVIARFGIEKYSDNYNNLYLNIDQKDCDEILRRNGIDEKIQKEMFSQYGNKIPQILMHLDTCVLKVIRNMKPKLQGVNVEFYSTESAMDIETSANKEYSFTYKL